MSEGVMIRKRCCCCCWVASVVSDSVRPHRRQPTRLLCPWDSPGKNTGVGCHCLLQCVKVKSESEVAQSCLTLSDPMDCQPTRLLHPWDFPDKSTGSGLPLPSPERDGSYRVFFWVCPLVFGLYIYTQAYLKLVKEISLSFWSNDTQIFAYFRIISELVKKQNDVSPSPSWISDLVGWITFPISSQMILMLLVGNHAPYTLF